MQRSATHVLHELLDVEFPISDHRFRKVADGDNADQASVFQDRQVPDMFLGHKRHTRRPPFEPLFNRKKHLSLRGVNAAPVNCRQACGWNKL
ncbi:hypothetical protein USDA257_p00690 (plasmid) [Sinorhizobium fredii USDA 257]|uniref:Uncharacterized protein n=1 Tax=Sinorhizobium fredii (strain USDA 257) TaxID=1185652 RepID=I3XFY1_SINF2|nr:hypothetical protein USDA257_p00690 [Sinorhizobium fredii USDA 257]CCE99074.1 hypothetical protein SFHH103_04600 [Sinorhizobium fredii HH103]